MNENEHKQQKQTDLLLIENGLKLMKVKLNVQKVAAALITKNEDDLKALNDSYDSQLKRTDFLIYDTQTQIKKLING